MKTRRQISPKATTAEPSNSRPANLASTGSGPAATAETIQITPDNSKVLFTGSKVTGKHEGGFKEFTGSIELINGRPVDSRVSVDIDSASVFVDEPKLADHLKTADFFDVEKFPKAKFISTKIVPDEKGGDAYMVTGDLELHGTTKSITFPATISVSDEAVAVNADFSINRKDFGIMYAGKADDLIRDNVVLTLNLNVARQNKRTLA